ncbi:MAG: hypothetical protein IT340_20045 [Chloroflexi bacterium]|nr:hypothetical protein [Chloroflexota bacterium]
MADQELAAINGYLRSMPGVRLASVEQEAAAAPPDEAPPPIAPTPTPLRPSGGAARFFEQRGADPAATSPAVARAATLSALLATQAAAREPSPMNDPLGWLTKITDAARLPSPTADPMLWATALAQPVLAPTMLLAKSAAGAFRVATAPPAQAPASAPSPRSGAGFLDLLTASGWSPGMAMPEEKEAAWSAPAGVMGREMERLGYQPQSLVATQARRDATDLVEAYMLLGGEPGALAEDRDGLLSFLRGYTDAKFGPDPTGTRYAALKGSAATAAYAALYGGQGVPSYDATAALVASQGGNPWVLWQSVLRPAMRVYGLTDKQVDAREREFRDLALGHQRAVADAAALRQPVPTLQEYLASRRYEPLPRRAG